MEWERQRTYDFESGKEAGIKVGLEAGKEAKAKESAIALLKENIPPETISKCIKLPLEKVLELQKDILVEV
jgi:hypothetical protein